MGLEDRDCGEAGSDTGGEDVPVDGAIQEVFEAGYATGGEVVFQ